MFKVRLSFGSSYNDVVILFVDDISTVFDQKAF